MKRVLSKKSREKNTFRWGGIHPFFYHPFILTFFPDLRNETILDCGCGKGIYAYLMRTVRDLEGAKLIGVDTCQRYLNFCKKYKIYDKLIKANINKLPIKDKSIDFLLCSEVIEHLDKEDGEKFLNEVERVCRGRAVITTPNVWLNTCSQGGSDAHRSKWEVDHFQERGYKVYGIGVRIPSPRGGWWNRIIYALYYLLTPVSYFFPKMGGYLIAVKDFETAPPQRGGRSKN